MYRLELQMQCRQTNPKQFNYEKQRKTSAISHYTRFPRSSCSLSIASKSDLKFPAPNPEKLCR